MSTAGRAQGVSADGAAVETCARAPEPVQQKSLHPAGKKAAHGVLPWRAFKSRRRPSLP